MIPLLLNLYVPSYLYCSFILFLMQHIILKTAAIHCVRWLNLKGARKSFQYSCLATIRYWAMSICSFGDSSSQNAAVFNSYAYLFLCNLAAAGCRIWRLQPMNFDVSPFLGAEIGSWTPVGGGGWKIKAPSDEAASIIT